jgi:hypothetical protein
MTKSSKDIGRSATPCNEYADAFLARYTFCLPLWAGLVSSRPRISLNRSSNRGSLTWDLAPSPGGRLDEIEQLSTGAHRLENMLLTFFHWLTSSNRPETTIQSLTHYNIQPDTPIENVLAMYAVVGCLQQN